MRDATEREDEEPSGGALCRVLFGSGEEAQVPGGATVLNACRKAGVRLETPCDGKGLCGKCRVKVRGDLDPPGEEEKARLLTRTGEGFRLACRTIVRGAVFIDLADRGAGGLRIVERGERRSLAIDPPTKKIIREWPGGDEDGSLWDGLKPGAVQDAGPEIMAELLRNLAGESTSGTASRVEIVVRGDRLLDVRFSPGGKCLGIALDIGTTTMVAEMVDLESGETVGILSCLNPQTAYGGDVLTRVSYCIAHEDGVRALQAEVAKGINTLIDGLCAAHGVGSNEIYDMVVAGNTTMLHLLPGVDPRSLARFPYRPVFTHQLHVTPGSIGLRMAPRGTVTILPSASAFVGADIIAGMLASNFHKSLEPSLFIDIGTNGEIAVVRDDLLVGTSSAAGPALEGMNIECGCRAEEGAVESVAISGDGTLKLDVIGGVPPGGICGSGLIDLIAELLRVGVMTPDGRLGDGTGLPGRLAERLVEYSGKRRFRISEDGEVFLTQRDIRQVQLAKGAMATGIALLLKELGLEYRDLRRVLVAGAFGTHLRPSTLVAIGLLPRELERKTVPVGNTAKEGARMILINSGCGDEMQAIRSRLKIKELSIMPDFQGYFIRHLNFPG